MGRNYRPRKGSVVIGASLWAAAVLLSVAAQAQNFIVNDAPLLVSGDSGEALNPGGNQPLIIGSTVLEREVDCLARNIYWEAGGEPTLGKIAVAAVTLNRTIDGRFPGTVCGVVNQRVSASRGCQFSWACSWRLHQTPTGARWREAVEVAQMALSAEQPDPTRGALYFHGVRERPSWSRQKQRAVQIGNHIFYRDWMSAENGASEPRY